MRAGLKTRPYVRPPVGAGLQSRPAPAPPQAPAICLERSRATDRASTSLEGNLFFACLDSDAFSRRQQMLEDAEGDFLGERAGFTDRSDAHRAASLAVAARNQGA